MRVLQAHNRYKISGGEDVAVKSEFIILKKNNNIVNLFEVSNQNISGWKTKIITALKVSYSRKFNNMLSERIRVFKPEIIHVHNFFPLITPSIYDVAKKFSVPVIQTLHNYRIICPGAYLVRKGKICEDCLYGPTYQAALHKCYRDSAIGSFAVAHMVQKHKNQLTWDKKINRFIVPSEFAKKKFVQAGLSSEIITVKPNFIYPDPGIRNANGKFALFVGRISKEKGILTLMQAIENIERFPVKIIGDGPMIEDINKIKNYKSLSNIEIIGQHNRKEVFQLIHNAAFIIFPSEWYETFGLVCAEAFACGKPVITSRLGSMAEIVEDGVTGLHFEAGNPIDLADKINWLIKHPDECRKMGRNARMEYLDKYTAEKNYESLMDIYQQALNDYK